MASSEKNLSYYDHDTIPDGVDMKIGLVVSEWNAQITNGLLEGAKSTLLKHGVPSHSILELTVPGAFELALGAQYLFEQNVVDGLVCLGSVIRGETKHFDFVCHGATQGVMNAGLKYNKPAIFGLLTDENKQQALDRSGGKLGNKGIECAIACMKMIALKRDLK